MEGRQTVLIIGGSGFLGTHLALKLRDDYKVMATYHSKPIQIPGVMTLPFSLRDPEWIKRAIYTVSPDVVIYAAGSNSVIAAERDTKLAEAMHVAALAPVLKASTIFQPRFIYLSNCYTFDGSRGNYREGDTILASTSLGKLKVSGENLVRSRALNYAIVRLSPVFGRGNGLSTPFLDRLRISLGRKQKIPMDGTEVHSYVAIPSVTDFIKRLIESGPRNRIYHFGGITKCTQYDFARAFAKRFKFDPSLVVQSGQAQHHPRDYSLNSTETAQMLKLKPLLLDEGFDALERGIRG